MLRINVLDGDGGDDEDEDDHSSFGELRMACFDVSGIIGGEEYSSSWR